MNAFVTKCTSGACGTEYVRCCVAGCVGLKSAARVTGWGSGCAITLHLLHCSRDVRPVAPEYRPAAQLVHVGAVAAFVAVPYFPMEHAADLHDG